jgi:hypothetical protein
MQGYGQLVRLSPSEQLNAHLLLTPR